MTSLPIKLPTGSTLLIKKGDSVTKGQVLATVSSQDSTESSSSSASHVQEVVLSLSDHFGEQPGKVGKYLLKSPGERISIGEVIAVKKGGFTLKTVRLVSQIKGTVMRFERGAGTLIIRLDQGKTNSNEVEKSEAKKIVSPLDGTVASCNNKTIILESESDALVGTKGCGQEVEGEIDTSLYTEGSVASPVQGSAISKELIDKIILVSSIEREALVKADAIGVKGVITTSISDSDITYLSQKHFGLPVVEVDESVAKQIQMIKAPHVILNGREKSLIETS